MQPNKLTERLCEFLGEIASELFADVDVRLTIVARYPDEQTEDIILSDDKMIRVASVINGAIARETAAMVEDAEMFRFLATASMRIPSETAAALAGCSTVDECRLAIVNLAKSIEHTHEDPAS